MRVRSILWIGPGAGFAADVARDAPLLDVVWEPDVDRSRAHALERFDLVVLDAAEGPEAREAGARLRGRRGCPPVLLRGDPGGDGRLRERIEELIASGEARPGDASPEPTDARFPGVVGTSPALREALDLVLCAARSAVTVLLYGETGTGKEVLARTLHERSARRGRAFVAANCAAFSETLLESELFGHLKGSFTGADRDRKGLVEEADGGTLLLDEVSETSGPFQAKLLRVLQEREVRPVGAARPRRVDVRIVAATNRDLARLAGEGRFREDLYYRLAVFPIRLPPLRERRPDIPLLAAHLLARHAAGGRTLSPEARALLLGHRWPGNVRELENELLRAHALAPAGAPLGPEHFSRRLREALPPVEARIEPGETLRETLDRVEAWLIRRALDAQGGRRARTARRLGLTREGLYKKMQRLGID